MFILCHLLFTISTITVGKEPKMVELSFLRNFDVVFHRQLHQRKRRHDRLKLLRQPAAARWDSAKQMCTVTKNN